MILAGWGELLYGADMNDLKPGRELDALIAEKVMGWTEIDLDPAKRSNSYNYGFGINPVHGIENAFPNYSTDIAAAWPIVEMFKERGDYKIEISAYPKDSCWTIKAYGKKSCTTSAKTLPHAICLAALKAIEK